MISLSRLHRHVLGLAGMALLLSTPSFAAGLSASAAFTATNDPSIANLYDYSLVLKNTGTTNIGTFWFAWVPGGDFLNPTPTSATQPTGWGSEILPTAQGTSIQWTTTSALLGAGQSLSGFNFTSTESPSQLLGFVPSGTGAGDPVTTAFVYIGAPFADPGSQFVATAATPEPSSLALLATGLLGGAGTLYRRFHAA